MLLLLLPRPRPRGVRVHPVGGIYGGRGGVHLSNSELRGCYRFRPRGVRRHGDGRQTAVRPAAGTIRQCVPSLTLQRHRNEGCICWQEQEYHNKLPHFPREQRYRQPLDGVIKQCTPADRHNSLQQRLALHPILAARCPNTPLWSWVQGWQPKVS